MIADLKKMNAGTEVKGLPLMIKTARNIFKDADGTTFQEVVFMDGSGEMTGHILLEVTDHNNHGYERASKFKEWKSKTNLCIMDGVLQDTDERKKEGVKLVVFECFDAATPLTYEQGQDLQAEDWRRMREDEIRGKVRHWVACSLLHREDIEVLRPEPVLKKAINEWVEFIMTGE